MYYINLYLFRYKVIVYNQLIVLFEYIFDKEFVIEFCVL